MRRIGWAVGGFMMPAVVLAQSLDRPDPGIGEGFATAMTRQFREAFGINEAEAKCLVYEVMTDLRATKNYQQTSVQIAEKVAPRCGLALRTK